MKRRKLILGAGGVAAAAALGAGCSQGGPPPVSADSPDILVFLTDDQHARALHSRDPFYVTPHLDALAAAGYLINDSFVTTSICPVSRACILSGQMAERNRHMAWLTPMTEHSLANSFPLQLKRHGYQIGFIGKWGIANPLPAAQFDYVDSFEGQGEYYGPDGKDRHLTARMADSAVRAIDQFSASDRPYMLMVSFNAPHGQAGLPFAKTPDPALQYPEFDFSVHSSVPRTVDDFDRLPDFLKASAGRRFFDGELRGLPNYLNYVANYAKLIYGVDLAVGQVLDRARQRKPDEQLEVLHLSDNGMMMGEHGLFGKWLMFEDSIRIPFIWKPSRYSRHAAQVQASMVLNIDVAPTVLTAAGVSVPSSYQGVSLQRQAAGERRDEFYYCYHVSHNGTLPVCHGLRGRRYKYIEYDEHDYRQLFDLQEDPQELHNLIDDPQYADMAETLHTRLQRFRRNAGPRYDGRA